ncbi:hypothetical protein NE236_38285 [Actinoallomurus purpureus]|uniref:hypothetical protein n=1 Tax=Actinoallomurus purpureus TaxID=478114 RepID=UPI002093E27E|nr:hypothetical protein [Actinoallomurus purpureus]MCO6010824.1 hypothetical protein [Actinoallomurus purpureus]
MTAPARLRAILSLALATVITTGLTASATASATSANTTTKTADQTVTVDVATMSDSELAAIDPAAKLDPPQYRIRVAIAKNATTQIGQPEHPSQCGGKANCYPKAYKVNKDVARPAEWCGVFVNWAWTRGGATRQPSMKGKDIDQGHWATYWQKWGKKVARWHKTPDIGDAIVYGNYPASTHIGVVVGVKYQNGKVVQVRTVEGNVGDKVTDKKWRKIGSLYGRGYKASGFVSPVVGG